MSPWSVSTCTELRTGVKECQAQKLRKQDGFTPLSASDIELEGIQLDSIRNHQALLSANASEPATIIAATSSTCTNVQTKATGKCTKSHVKAVVPLQAAITTPAVAMVDVPF